MSKHNYRRQQVVVDPALQRRMIVAAVWPPAICYLVIATSLLILYGRMSGAAAQAEVAFDGVKPVFVGVLLLFISAIVFQVIHSLRLSHRVAGPLYRFQKTLKAVQEGDLSARAGLREGDLLVSTAVSLNEFLDWVEQHPPATNQASEETSEAQEPTPTPASTSE